MSCHSQKTVYFSCVKNGNVFDVFFKKCLMPYLPANDDNKVIVKQNKVIAEKYANYKVIIFKFFINVISAAKLICKYIPSSSTYYTFLFKFFKFTCARRTYQPNWSSSTVPISEMFKLIKSSIFFNKRLCLFKHC